ncbi:MAG: hypothetical protein U9P88_02590 [Patescibacteria group bacterium]|nr:hypothetical protein [Patescibacteria group bacterium]
MENKEIGTQEEKQKESIRLGKEIKRIAKLLNQEILKEKKKKRKKRIFS